MLIQPSGQHSTKLTLNESVDYEKVFKQSFESELNRLTDIPEEHASMIRDMKVQGIELASMVLEALNIKFPGYKVVSAEEEIFEPIIDSPSEYDYKGFLDLVVKTPDGKYHIIDWKSCSWGWDIKRKTERMSKLTLDF